MFWPHTKTLIPTEAGNEFIVEMLTPPFAKHTVAFTTNSVPYIITPPLSRSSKVSIGQKTKIGTCPLMQAQASLT
jgi:hypothetical protein